jgi:hypothetical protein
MGNRDSQSVGSIGARDRSSGKQPRHHRVNLRLFGASGADHGLLDEPGRIFADRHSRTRGDHQDHSTRLPELQGRLRVLVYEHFLDGYAVGLVLGKQPFELFGEGREPIRQGR